MSVKLSNLIPLWQESIPWLEVWRKAKESVAVTGAFDERNEKNMVWQRIRRFDGVVCKVAVNFLPPR
jgi:hypothetical protein